MYNPILLWSNVPTDCNLVALYDHMKKLNPTATAKELRQMQERVIPVLLDTVVADITPVLPKNMIAFHLKTDRRSPHRVKAELVEINQFSVWIDAFRTANTGTHHILLTDIGDIVQYSINEDFIETSYLRMLCKPEMQQDIAKLKQQITGCVEEPMVEHMMKQISIPLGYLVEKLYRLKLRLPHPENGPDFPEKINTRHMPVERIIRGHTPANIKPYMHL